jgi:chloramphenicol-sensitive protein RarD
MSESQKPAFSYSRSESAKGAAYAALAFLIWGLSPVYWKAMSQVPALQIATHRVVWSCALILLMTIAQKRWHEFTQAVKRRRTLLTLSVTTVLLSANWLLYIWAVNNGHLLQASLGYYINPLVNVVLGMVVLQERLSRPQALAVLLALAGVVLRTMTLGAFPWIALTLAFSFGFYGLIRKVAPVGPLVGLALETLLMTGPGVVFLIALEARGSGVFLHESRVLDLLLMGTSVVTAVPLLLFNLGARRIKLATLGLMQYIAPSGMFLSAILLFDEPFTLSQLWTFLLIWTALAVYSFDSLRAFRQSA